MLTYKQVRLLCRRRVKLHLIQAPLHTSLVETSHVAGEILSPARVDMQLQVILGCEEPARQAKPPCFAAQLVSIWATVYALVHSTGSWLDVLQPMQH